MMRDTKIWIVFALMFLLCYIPPNVLGLITGNKIYFLFAFLAIFIFYFFGILLAYHIIFNLGEQQ